jgi:hypothetical protein
MQPQARLRPGTCQVDLAFRPVTDLLPDFARAFPFCSAARISCASLGDLGAAFRAYRLRVMAGNKSLGATSVAARCVVVTFTLDGGFLLFGGHGSLQK